MRDVLIPLSIFAVATSFTPGPNVLLVTASSANFGLRRTLPHILGILVGFPAMTLAIGFGLGEVFAASPSIHRVLKIVGSAYLLYLAYRTAVAGEGKDGEARGRPMSFWQAVAFQWVNPKAWLMIVGSISAYTTVGGDPWREVLLIALVFAVVTLPGLFTWALFGVAIGRLLRSRRAWRTFNLVMAALLVASLVPMVA